MNGGHGQPYGRTVGRAREPLPDGTLDTTCILLRCSARVHCVLYNCRDYVDFSQRSASTLEVKTAVMQDFFYSFCGKDLRAGRRVRKGGFFAKSR